MNETFWHGKKVLVTGHTGFKGSWLLYLLADLGAQVFGVSDADKGSESLFVQLRGQDFVVNNELGLAEYHDIADLNNLITIINEFQPEIIFHLAAQPLVLHSYVDPISTFKTNVLGTVNLLEASKFAQNLRSIISVTTDKVYLNNGEGYSFREGDPLGGDDPYSSSKACADIATKAYYQSFLKERGVGVSSVRAGNVIGGGDTSENRLIPDIVKCINTKSTLTLRNPDATRPWQHVLDPLFGYLLLAEKMYTDSSKYSFSMNFGPSVSDVLSVKEVVKIFAEAYGVELVYQYRPGLYHEAANLSLDCTLAYSCMSWKPIWNANEALNRTAEWYQLSNTGKDLKQLMADQINAFKEDASKTRSF